jgi:hypothetical protein
MIKAYINYPRPHMTLHTDSTCSDIGKIRKPNQRDVSVTRVSFATAIAQLTGKGFRLGADSSINDVWLSVDFDDAEVEEAVARYVFRSLGGKAGQEVTAVHRPTTADRIVADDHSAINERMGCLPSRATVGRGHRCGGPPRTDTFWLQGPIFWFKVPAADEFREERCGDRMPIAATLIRLVDRYPGRWTNGRGTNGMFSSLNNLPSAACSGVVERR